MFLHFFVHKLFRFVRDLRRGGDRWRCRSGRSFSVCFRECFFGSDNRVKWQKPREELVGVKQMNGSGVF